uniref:Uncharacterized protein n=1 Tax=Setaria digitata TaxID=48799 RepID=A0A915Q5Y6_9BILA
MFRGNAATGADLRCKGRERIERISPSASSEPNPLHLLKEHAAAAHFYSFQGVDST